MNIFDWLLVGLSAAVVKKLDKETDYDDYKEYDYKNSFNDVEIDRIKRVNSIRSDSFVKFDEGISEDEFERLAKKAAKHFKRIVKVEVYGAYIYATVESQSGASEWEFELDFNDWGHITGTFWKPYNENYDSEIYIKYGLYLSGLIQDYIEDNDLDIKEYSDIVNKNKHLGVGKLSYHPKENVIKKHITKRYKRYKIEYNYDELIGEHVYVVTSIFRNLGFKNIYVLEAKEAHSELNNKKEYEVFNITINGEKGFRWNTLFKENDEIKIYYYGKKQIQSTKSNRDFKNENYKEVGYELYDMGFTKVYVHEINDVKLGLLKKEGAVEKVLVNDKPINKKDKYFYDSSVDIYYHTK